jgi:hypothetical protein
MMGSTTSIATATILKPVLEHYETGSSKETQVRCGNCRSSFQMSSAASSAPKQNPTMVFLEIHESLIYSRFAISPAVLANRY